MNNKFYYEEYYNGLYKGEEQERSGSGRKQGREKAPGRRWLVFGEYLLHFYTMQNKLC